MITQMKSFKKTRVLWMLATCLLLSLSGYGQYNLIYPNIFTPEITVANPANDVVWLNNSVFNMGGTNTFYAEVWDEGGGNGCFLNIQDANGNTPVTNYQLAATLPGVASHPDVVLGGDGTHCYVAAVYTQTYLGFTNIRLEVYTVSVVLGTITLNTCTTWNYPITNATANHVGDAHIDVANVLNGTTVKADLLAIAWEETSGCGVTLSYGAKARATTFTALTGTGCGSPTFISSACLNSTAFPATRGQQVDIAVRYDGSAAQYHAAVTYLDDNLGNVYVGDWNITTNTVTTGAVFDNPGTGNAQYPRIDITDEPNPFTPCMQAEVVYRYKDVGSGIWNVMSLNNILTAGTDEEATSFYNTGLVGTALTDNTNPVVACGSANNTNATNNNFYSIAYANPPAGGGLDEVFVQNIDWQTGLITDANVPGNRDYYIVNNNNTIDGPVAIASDWIDDPSTSSLMLADEIFVCWVNRSGLTPTIDCKITNAIPPSFKPTSTAKVGADYNIGTTVYPNPADDKLYIAQSGKTAISYSVCDILGRVQLKGQIRNKIQEVDIRTLAKGLYLVNTSYDDGSVDGFKIVKE